MSKSINFDYKKLPEKLQPLLAAVQTYIKFIFFVFASLLGAFLIFQINHFASVEPSEDEVSEKLQTVQRPHIDENSLQKIQQLQDQNVQVQSLFEQTRDNPFSE